MTIAKWSLLAAFALPIVTVGLAKAASFKRAPGSELYDNHKPRDWEARQTGWQARALAAHNNGFEILPLFVAAVLLAQMAQADQARIDQLALAFIGLRLAFSAVYLMNLATLRTLVWSLSVAVCVALLALAA